MAGSKVAVAAADVARVCSRLVQPKLRVQVIGDNIVVTLPGYSYAVTYYKPAGNAGLLMKYRVTNDDMRLRTGAEFLAAAWKCANAKARELGWIV